MPKSDETLDSDPFGDSFADEAATFMLAQEGGDKPADAGDDDDDGDDAGPVAPRQVRGKSSKSKEPPVSPDSLVDFDAMFAEPALGEAAPAVAPTEKATPERKPLEPTPEQRFQMMFARQQAQHRAELQEMQRQSDARFEQLISRLAPEAAPEVDEDDDPLADELEKRVTATDKRLTAEIQALRAAENERRQDHVMREIQSEVSTAVASAPHLEVFQDQIYTAIARDAQRAMGEAERSGQPPKYTPISTIIKSFDAQLRSAAARLQGVPAGGSTPASAASARAAAPATQKAQHPAVPSGRSSSVSQPVDISRMSFEDLGALYVKKHTAAQRR